MSQAEDLLTTLTADQSTEEHIVIKPDRYIVVPDALKRIAVQGDHNIETVTFDCPRYWDEHDLSTMIIKINYIRSDTKTGGFKAKNIRVDETDNSIIHFEWTVSGNVTEVNGTLTFLVCATKVSEEDGIVQSRWHSELNSDMYISKGETDHGDETLSELYPDIITQILADLDTTSADLSVLRASAVKSVNDTQPDEEGNVNLEIATSWNDLEDKPFWYEESTITKTLEILKRDVGENYSDNLEFTEFAVRDDVDLRITVTDENNTVLLDSDMYERDSTYNKYERYWADVISTTETNYFKIGFDRIKENGEYVYRGRVHFLENGGLETWKTITLTATLSENPFHTLDEQYLPETTKFQSDYEENDETKPGYIKNKPFGTTRELNPVVENLNIFSELTDTGTICEEYSSGWLSSHVFELKKNTKYLVLLDGKTYMLESIETQYGAGLGNMGFLANETNLPDGFWEIEKTDTGEPFGICYSSYDRTIVRIYTETEGVYTLSIYEITNESVKQFDEKYLPKSLTENIEKRAQVRYINAWASADPGFGYDNNDGRYECFCDLNLEWVGDNTQSVTPALIHEYVSKGDIVRLRMPEYMFEIVVGWGGYNSDKTWDWPKYVSPANDYADGYLYYDVTAHSEQGTTLAFSDHYGWIVDGAAESECVDCRLESRICITEDDFGLAYTYIENTNTVHQGDWLVENEISSNYIRNKPFGVYHEWVDAVFSGTKPEEDETFTVLLNGPLALTEYLIETDDGIYISSNDDFDSFGLYIYNSARESGNLVFVDLEPDVPIKDMSFNFNSDALEVSTAYLTIDKKDDGFYATVTCEPYGTTITNKLYITLNACITRVKKLDSKFLPDELVNNTAADDFTGATSEADGSSGLVPSPTTADADKFLKGNGTWASVTYPQELDAELTVSEFADLPTGFYYVTGNIPVYLSVDEMNDMAFEDALQYAEDNGYMKQINGLIYIVAGVYGNSDVYAYNLGMKISYLGMSDGSNIYLVGLNHFSFDGFGYYEAQDFLGYDKEQLETEAKTIVGAINELNAAFPSTDDITKLIDEKLGVIENDSY